jgi:ParB family chromosome partitioning protein
MLPDTELLNMIIENGQRAGLDPIEEGRALAKLKAQTGLTDLEVARKVGMSQPRVSGRLALLALPIEDQEELRTGQVTLTAAIETARINSGKVRPAAKGKKSAAHFSVHHTLGSRAKARCARLGHKKGGSASVGGIACGECWESVIRADERDHLNKVSNDRGRCVLCDVTHDPDANPLSA